MAASSPEEIAESFVAALEALDGDSAEGLISDEGAGTYLSAFCYGEEQPGKVVGLWEWAAIHGTTYTSDGVGPATTSAMRHLPILQPVAASYSLATISWRMIGPGQFPGSDDRPVPHGGG